MNMYTHTLTCVVYEISRSQMLFANFLTDLSGCDKLSCTKFGANTYKQTDKGTWTNQLNSSFEFERYKF